MNLSALIDEVKAVIAGMTFTLDTGEPAIVIQRRYVAVEDKTKLAGMHIDIAAGGVDLDLATRSEISGDQKVGIAIRQCLPSTVRAADESGSAWIENRIARALQIIREMASLEFDEATLTNIDNTPQFDPKSLTEGSVFSTLVVLTFSSID